MECAPHRGESAQHWIIEEQMHFLEVPEVVVLRLPMYVRALTQLTDGGADVVSSQQLGGLLQMTPAQIAEAQALATEWWEKIDN